MTNPVIARSLRFTRTCSADRSYEAVGTGYSLGRTEQLRPAPLATRGRSPVSDDLGITGKSGRSLPMLHVSSGVFLRSSRYSTTPTENTYITSLRRNQWTTAEYYDLVLGLIPLAFVGATGALILSGIGLTTAVPLGHSSHSDSSSTGCSSTGQSTRPHPRRVPMETPTGRSNPRTSRSS
jgi:hypothetical protein